MINIKKILRGIYFAIISMVLVSIFFATWTSYIFISETSKSTEISKVINDMYQSQKSFAINTINLTRILLEDKGIESENNTFQLEQELDIENTMNNHLEEPFPTEEDGSNPLGIVIKPSLEMQDLDNQELGISIEKPYSNLEGGKNPLGIIIEPSDRLENLDDESIDSSLAKIDIEDYIKLDDEKS